MKLKYLFSIAAFSVFNVSQSSAQSHLKTASPGFYPAINQLSGQYRFPMPDHGANLNANVGARTTTVSPLMREVDASYSTASSSYMANDSTLFTYSGGRGYDAKTYSYLYDNDYYWTYIPYLGALRYVEKQSQTFDISNNVLTDLNQQWDTATSSWKNSSNTVNTYDAANNLITNTFQTWNTSSSNWSDYSRYVYTYDASGNELTRKNEFWDGTSTSWINSDLYTYTYDSHNNMLTETYQYILKTVLTNYTLKTYTYDASNNKTSETDQIWNTTSSSWQNNGKYTFTYSGTNKVLSYVTLAWDTLSSSWVNASQTLYTYSASDNPVIILSQTWNGGSWQNTYQYVEKFNSTHDDTDLIVQIWNTTTSTWNNNYESKATFDANHDYLTYIYGTWDTTALAFIYTYRYSYNYNSDYQTLTETENEWNSGGYWNSVDGDIQYRYYYDNSTAVNNINKEGTVKVYPIPANDIMNMDLNWDTPQSAVVGIYNMQGVLCRQWQIPASSNTHHSIPVLQLPAGNYILKITGEEGQLSQQVSIIH
ncbi:MAG TPA: T9SS type A sorting domain-containing protein [Flavipsychrobacter sp.]|nr:T9SS type A sorting domain-containing protein [Flavipsychrobacter sp.]